MRIFTTGLTLVLIAGMALAQTAGSEMKQAGSDVKDAAKETGKATKKTAKKVGRGTKNAVHKGADKVADKTQ